MSDKTVDERAIERIKRYKDMCSEAAKQKARAEAAEKRVAELENEIFGEMVRSDYRSIADIRNAVKLAEAQRDTYREAFEAVKEYMDENPTGTLRGALVASIVTAALKPDAEEESSG